MQRCGRMPRPCEPVLRVKRLIWWEMSRSVSVALGASHARLCLGGGPTLPPASGLLLVAVIGVFSALWRRWLLGFYASPYGPSETRPLHNPPPCFHYRVYRVASAMNMSASIRGGAHPVIMDALAEMPEAGNAKCRCEYKYKCTIL